MDLWVRFVLLNPTQPFVPPASNTGNCQFRFGVEVPDQQNRIFTIDDANWIKAYNSVSGDGNGWYVQWAGAGWQYNLTNSENFDYVQHVCAAVQAQP